MTTTYQLATLGGGCFWCLEAVYKDVKGVQKVVSGYAGGHIADPSYQQVCTGRTGHAEVIQITFDPNIISYKDLLYIFWRIHDPTTLNRQGADAGTQYRSAIYYHTPQQHAIANASLKETDAEKLWRNPIVTEVAPLDRFYPAEVYHQDYFANNPNQPYCRAVVDPKVQKFRKSFGEWLK